MDLYYFGFDLPKHVGKVKRVWRYYQGAGVLSSHKFSSLSVSDERTLRMIIPAGGRALNGQRLVVIRATKGSRGDQKRNLSRN